LVIFVGTLMTFATRSNTGIYGKVLARNIAKNIMTGNLQDQPTIFHDLDPAQQDLLRALFVARHDPAGTVIFEQGDPAIHLYLIVEGEVNIRFKPDDGPSILVARVKPEGVVGWSAALGSPLYTSSAVCSVDCQMLRVSGRDLRRLCEQHPETGALLLERLAALIAKRLRNTHNHVIALLRQGLQININQPIMSKQ
jgi:CRP-like cAMP-binding protein